MIILCGHRGQDKKDLSEIVKKEFRLAFRKIFLTIGG